MAIYRRSKISNFYSVFKATFFAVTLQLSAWSCLGFSIADLDSLKDNVKNRIEITAPYSILSKANFTSDLHVYKYNNLILNIIEDNDPELVTLRISKEQATKELARTAPNYTLPWISSSAPSILQKLDFSKVDGNAAFYNIDTNHRLTLLPNQGCWGKVYILEEIDAKNGNKIICAVKVLLNKRPNQEAYFRQRHKTEIENNIVSNNFEIAVKTYAILENDPDHYLMFLEYGQHAKDRFAKQPLNVTLRDLKVFITELNAMHMNGYAHGDLNLGNLLYVDNKLKLCDWFSLTDVTQKTLSEYRYIGDNLPPEALRAFYYDKVLGSSNADMKYALDKDQNKLKAYWLHPIAADRFCFGVSLMDIVSPDLYNIIEKEPFSKDFNPYSPVSLEFWPKYSLVIKQMQFEMLQRSRVLHGQNDIQASLLNKIIDYIDLDPMRRI